MTAQPTIGMTFYSSRRRREARQLAFAIPVSSQVAFVTPDGPGQVHQLMRHPPVLLLLPDAPGSLAKL